MTAQRLLPLGGDPAQLCPRPVAGVDEAGRGPLAGPVVAAAVIIHPARPLHEVDDSKKLGASQREQLAQMIRARAWAWAVCVVDHDDIDRLNILQASLLAMQRAVHGLRVAPMHALVDGNMMPADLPCPAQTLVGGDALEPAISAASILAKTCRDAIMCKLDAVYPQYGFARHKGYATAAHRAALQQHGPCAIHRRSFAPVRDLLPVRATPA